MLSRKRVSFRLRANLDYGEEVHMLVKEFRYKARLFEATVCKVDEMGKTKKKTKKS